MVAAIIGRLVAMALHNGPTGEANVLVEATTDGSIDRYRTCGLVDSEIVEAERNRAASNNSRNALARTSIATANHSGAAASPEKSRAYPERAGSMPLPA